MTGTDITHLCEHIHIITNAPCLTLIFFFFSSHDSWLLRVHSQGPSIHPFPQHPRLPVFVHGRWDHWRTVSEEAGSDKIVYQVTNVSVIWRENSLSVLLLKERSQSPCCIWWLFTQLKQCPSVLSFIRYHTENRNDHLKHYTCILL